MSFDEITGSKSGGKAVENLSPVHEEVYGGNVKMAAADLQSGRSCDGNDSFEQIMDFSAKNIYDPKTLGDLSKVKSDFPCIETEEEAIKLADGTLKNADSSAGVTSLKSVWDSYMDKKSTGIGASVQETTEGGKRSYSVLSVLVGGAADAKGLKPGDVLTAINGESLANKSVEQVGEALRGFENEPVDIKFERYGKEMKPITIVRKPVVIPSMYSRTGGEEILTGGQALPDGVGYIRVENFQSHDLANKITDYLKSPTSPSNAKPIAETAKAMVLDLRGNPGGLIEPVGEVASLFIKQGNLAKFVNRVPNSDVSNPAYTEQRLSIGADNSPALADSVNDRSEQRFQSSKDVDNFLAVKNKQLFVLTDKGTAGSAEILAESLRVNAGAKLIGSDTHGHGVLGMAHQVKNSMVMIPTSRIYTPSGNWLGNGLKPDVYVTNPASATHGGRNDLQLKMALDSIK